MKNFQRITRNILIFTLLINLEGYLVQARYLERRNLSQLDITETLNSINIPSPSQSAKFLPDGKSILVGCDDNNIYQYDVETGLLLETYTGPQEAITRITISQDGNKFAASTNERLAGATPFLNYVYFFNINQANYDSRCHIHNDRSRGVDFNTDATEIATVGQDDLVIITKISDCSVVKNFSGSNTEDTYDVKFSPDGTKLASAQRFGKLIIWDIATVSEQNVYDKCSPNSSTSVSFSPDGRYVALACSLIGVYVFDLEDTVATEPISTFSDAQNQYQLQYSSDGKYIATTNANSLAYIINAQTMDIEHKYIGHSSTLFEVNYNFESKKIVTSGNENVVRIWNSEVCVKGEYKSDDQSCQKCPDLCLECISAFECTVCKFNCNICSYIPDEFDLITENPYSAGSGIAPVLQGSSNDNFGATGTVYRVESSVRFGTELPNTITTLSNTKKYQFCVWLRTVSGEPDFGTFYMDVGDQLLARRYYTDKYGNILQEIGNSQYPDFISNSWRRFCITSTSHVLASHRFVDIGSQGPGEASFEYCNPTLQEVPADNYSALPYTKNEVATECQQCSDYARLGSECNCVLGYTQKSSPNESECEFVNPSMCKNFLRVEASSWSTMHGSYFGGHSFLQAYLNDVQFADPTSLDATGRGINVITLDDDYAQLDHKSFDTYPDTSKPTMAQDCADYIASIPTGTKVLAILKDTANAGSNDELSPIVFDALTILGMNQYRQFRFRDSFVILGYKGAAPGSVPQRFARLINAGTALLSRCVECNYQCHECLKEENEFPLINSIEEGDKYDSNPQLEPEAIDNFGNKGTVYRTLSVNSYKKVRIGTHQPVRGLMADTIQKGFTYQFSVWIRKVSGQVPDTFDFDIVDKKTVFYISDSEGNILKDVTGSELNEYLSNEWQRFVINAHHDGDVNHNFIDIGEYDQNITWEYANPQLNVITDVYQLPIRFNDPNTSTVGCTRCSHYARILPYCNCATGYTETTPGQPECHAPVPENCTKFIRVESAGQNNQEKDTGSYFRIFMNDIYLESYEQGISVVQLNSDDFSIEESKTFENNKISDMIDYINKIQDGKTVVVGFNTEGAAFLNNDAYKSFQSLGLGSNVQLYKYDGFAMIGEKGSSPGMAQYSQGKASQGGKANVLKCLKGCPSQCKFCNLEGCLSCSDSTRILGVDKQCGCKEGYFEDSENPNVQCQSCDPKCEICFGKKDQCLSCSGELNRDTNPPVCGCLEGFYEDQETLACLSCKSDCKKCVGQDICLECNNSAYTGNICQLDLNKGFTVLNPDTNQYETGVCDLKCETCSQTADNCSNCAGLNRVQNPPFCECLNGYHDNQGNLQDCVKCPESCSQCVSFDLCLSCMMNNSRVNEFTGKCECNENFLLSSDKNGNYQCVPCYKFSDACLVNCPENTYQDEQNIMCVSIQSSEQSYTTVLYVGGMFIVLIEMLVIGIIGYALKNRFQQLGQAYNGVQQDEQSDEKKQIQLQNDIEQAEGKQQQQ